MSLFVVLVHPILTARSQCCSHRRVCAKLATTTKLAVATIYQWHTMTALMPHTPHLMAGDRHGLHSAILPLSTDLPCSFTDHTVCPAPEHIYLRLPSRRTNVLNDYIELHSDSVLKPTVTMKSLRHTPYYNILFQIAPPITTEKLLARVITG